MRARLLPNAALLAAALLAGAAAPSPAPAISLDITPVTPAGVGAVRLGATYARLRAAHRLGPARPGCELAGPQARSARLEPPLQGSVELTTSAPRRVATIAITRGATAHGVGIGATASEIRRSFPQARFDHSTDAMFGVTVVSARRRDVGRLQFALSTASRRVTEIGVPAIPFCE